MGDTRGKEGMSAAGVLGAGVGDLVPLCGADVSGAGLVPLCGVDVSGAGLVPLCGVDVSGAGVGGLVPPCGVISSISSVVLSFSLYPACWEQYSPCLKTQVETLNTYTSNVYVHVP